jgi:hypothetical protein
MEITLEYEVGPAVYMAHDEFLHPDAWSAWRKQHISQLLVSVVFLLLAIIAAYKAQLLTLLLVFFAILVVVAARLVTYRRTYRKLLAATLRTLPTKTVRLIAKDEGLSETVEGITSFAPWSSVVSFATFKDILFVELKAGLWAMIPRNGLTPSSASVEQLIEVLKGRQIPERKAPATS